MRVHKVPIATLQDQANLFGFGETQTAGNFIVIAMPSTPKEEKGV
jgi:hypothetical protein